MFGFRFLGDEFIYKYNCFFKIWIIDIFFILFIVVYRICFYLYFNLSVFESNVVFL